MDKTNHKVTTQKNDDEQWDLTVFDPDFNTFMASFAKPKSFYTLSYLKNKNTILTSQWNSLYYSGRYRNIIESNIDYDPNVNYGFDFEYKLYQVFAYVKWKYGLRFDGLMD